MGLSSYTRWRLLETALPLMTRGLGMYFLWIAIGMVAPALAWKAHLACVVIMTVGVSYIAEAEVEASGK